MTTTYTPNAQLAKPGSGDRTWDVPINGNAAVLDALAPIGGLCVTLHEVPSTTLAVKVAAGNYLKQDGSVGTYAGTASQAITLSTTKVLYLDLTSSGALTVGATFPTTAHIRLAVVVAGATTISSITDARIGCSPIGTFFDGINLTVGTTTGTKIGTATTQKLGFFNATPVVQPTMGVATAGASYTATEKNMLQAVYNAVRALGLGS